MLYGDAAAEDPFAGQIVGLLWGTGGGHGGDGTPTPVSVRGTDGVAAPITVFQQTILEELGTVIAWEEDGEPMGLYGRGFDAGQIPELLDIAEAIDASDGGFEIPPEHLPAGFAEVYRGSTSPLDLVLAVDSTYSISYVNPDTRGMITISGQEMSPDAFQAMRFLTIGLAPQDLDGKDALVGNAWHSAGPTVVAWQEPDGLVVRIVGLGTDLATVQAVAESTRDLNRLEWTDLVEGTSACFEMP